MNNTTNNTATAVTRTVQSTGVTKTFSDGDTLVCTCKHSPYFGMQATLVENGRCNQGTMMVSIVHGTDRYVDGKLVYGNKPIVIDWLTYDGGSAMIINWMDWSVVEA